MKVGAAVIGILFGIFAFFTFGWFVGGLGAMVESSGNSAGTYLKYLGIGLPLLAIAGGAVTFASRIAGGVMMLLAGGGILWLTQGAFMGLVIGGPIVLAAVLAFISASSKPKPA